MSVEFTTTNITTDVFSEDLMSVANNWAEMFAESLGITESDDVWIGSESISEFKGRVLMALAVAPYDEGLVGDLAVTPFGAVLVTRDEGYLQEKLEALLRIVESGERQGHDLVVWG